jgi:hypothetical protein
MMIFAEKLGEALWTSIRSNIYADGRLRRKSQGPSPKSQVIIKRLSNQTLARGSRDLGFGPWDLDLGIWDLGFPLKPLQRPSASP